MERREAFFIKMNRYRAVLFDFDGVIGRTMEDNFMAWEYAFSAFNLDISKEAYFLIEGFSARRVAEHFLKDRAEQGLVEELVRLKEKYYIENCTFSFYEGVEPLVESLKEKQYLLGLVSGANSKRLSNSVGKKFLRMFNVIVTADRVKNCKPHPEPYLKASKALSCEPSECVAIENAPMGIEAAKSAGMYCVAICSTLDEKYLSKADRVVNNFMELCGIL